MKGLVTYSINNRAVTYFITFFLLVGGIASFFQLGQLEDPVFSVKTAVVITKYPGATPTEVELEVTDRLEKAIQEMSEVKRIYSLSSEGQSIIKVDIKDHYLSKELPQIWDFLRKKVGDATPKLPPGTEKPIVVDDFGFVYGFLIGLTGDGYSDRELERYAEGLKKDLSLVDGVSRVELWGVQPQAIYVDVAETQLAQLGISLNTVLNTLKTQNLVTDSGHLDIATHRLPIVQTGEFKSPSDIADLMIRPQAIDIIGTALAPKEKSKGEAPGTAEISATGETAKGTALIRLGDIANIRRGYMDPPATLMRYNGKPAVTIQVAGRDDANIVDVGKRLEKTIEAAQQVLPAGLEMHKIAWQADVVQESIRAFLINLIEAIIIVLIVLVIPSGMRMGLIIGIDLLLTILGTFIFMAVMEIPLQRMSLGALVIALGMMVDNAIVVSDGIAVRMRLGMDRVQAAVEAASSTGYPLFVATIVAVMAFFPIYLSKASTGEYCESLFTVVAASLILSWFVAMMLTPVQCLDMLPQTLKTEGTADGGEFSTPFYDKYRKLVADLVRYKYPALAALSAVLVASLLFFGFVKQMFFPDSSRPQLMVDLWEPAGTRIEKVSEDVKTMETAFQKDPRVNGISSYIGAGPPRFYLPVEPELPYSNYAEVIINFKDYRDIDPFIAEFDPWAKKNFPGDMLRFRKFAVGPSNTWKFEARYSGPADASLQELRHLGEEVQAVVETSPFGKDWRFDMQNPKQRIVLDYDQKRARWSGTSRNDISIATKRAKDGLVTGLYREKDLLIPILLRNVEAERQDLPERLGSVQVNPHLSVETVPLDQVISGSQAVWEDPIVIRFNRRRAITVQGDTATDATFPMLKKSVQGKMKEIELPPGYEMTWMGEEDSSKTSQESLVPGILPAALIIVFMTLTVFNAYRPLLIILLTIPFAMIGVTWGLLFLGTPFGFLALLGLMSLAGMMNKNIVVLLDSCNDFRARGVSPHRAIIEASVTRARPVMLAAGTTVLGVIPLVPDVFWTAMAVTIMAGLAFGSLLTLLAVPVLYAILYRVEIPKGESNPQ